VGSGSVVGANSEVGPSAMVGQSVMLGLRSSDHAPFSAAMWWLV
jgi:hypothetical protein